MTEFLVYLASDHRGVALKAKVAEWLQGKKIKYIDLGTDNEQRCDAGDFAQRAAQSMKENIQARGVLICGTGQAMAMTANRYRHIRAALCDTPTVARLSRQHNDANVIVFGADIIGEAVAMDCLEIFMTTDFLGGRYAERRDKLTALGGLG